MEKVEKTNDELILEVLGIYPVMTVEMIAKELGVEQRTIGNRMSMLAKEVVDEAGKVVKRAKVKRQVYKFKRGGKDAWMYLYYVKGSEIKQVWHTKAIAEEMLKTRQWQKGRVHSSGVTWIEEVKLEPDWGWYYEDDEGLIYVFDEVQKKPDEFREKCERYLECARQGYLRKYGIENFIVRTISETEARMETLRRIARQVSNGSDLFWFRAMEWPMDRYKRSDDEREHSLLE